MQLTLVLRRTAKDPKPQVTHVDLGPDSTWESIAGQVLAVANGACVAKYHATRATPRTQGALSAERASSTASRPTRLPITKVTLVMEFHDHYESAALHIKALVTKLDEAAQEAMDAKEAAKKRKLPDSVRRLVAAGVSLGMAWTLAG